MRSRTGRSGSAAPAAATPPAGRRGSAAPAASTPGHDARTCRASESSDVCSVRASARPTAASRAAEEASPHWRAGPARRRGSRPASSASRRAMTWRSRRLTRLRVTAGPTGAGDHEADPGGRDRRAMSHRRVPRRRGPRRALRPACPRARRSVAVKSARRRSRDPAGSTSVRPRGASAPWSAGRPGSRGRHGCACAGGTRGSSRDGGCWAGTCACSLVGSRREGRAVLERRLVLGSGVDDADRRAQIHRPAQTVGGGQAAAAVARGDPVTVRAADAPGQTPPAPAPSGGDHGRPRREKYSGGLWTTACCATRPVVSVRRSSGLPQPLPVRRQASRADPDRGPRGDTSRRTPGHLGTTSRLHRLWMTVWTARSYARTRPGRSDGAAGSLRSAHGEGRPR